jgi:hypothetical protein
MSRKRKTQPGVKSNQVQHPNHPVPSDVGKKNPKPKRRLRFKELLPTDDSFEWPVVAVKRAGGVIQEVSDIKRTHESRIRDSFYATYPKVYKKLFDEEMARVIWEAAILNDDEEEEAFRFLYTPPLVFWARVFERLEGSNSFVEHWLITPKTLVEFVMFAMDAFQGDDGRPRHLYSSLKYAVERLTDIHSQQFWPDYDGPEDTYLVREKRVVKNLQDVDLDGPGPDEDTEGEKEERVYKSAEFVSAADDESDDEMETEPSKEVYNVAGMKASLEDEEERSDPFDLESLRTVIARIIN